jgi:hypothetical protein
MSKAIKEFEIVEGSTERMWYQIKVYYHGELVDVFEYQTMQNAVWAFEAAGYRKIQN